MFQNKKQEIKFNILLHDIRSVQNVASIFRLADCIGVNEIIISGATPSPLDRFGNVRNDFAKISLGSEESIKWTRVGNEIVSDINLNEKNEDNLDIAIEYIKNFKLNNRKNLDKNSIEKNEERIVIALEQSKKSIDYKNLEQKVLEKYNLNNSENFKQKKFKDCEFLIIPGREVEGLDERILNLLEIDFICEIPQYGQKESLNIFSSLSVAIYRWFDLK